MSDADEKTVKIERPTRAGRDDRGGNVWLGHVETIELELMSTAALESALKSGDRQVRSEIQELARSRKDGVLARDVATGHFRILSEDDMKSFVPADPASDPHVPEQPKSRAEVTTDPISESVLRAADELSLVSTQVLRQVVESTTRNDPSGGYDPYNKT